MTKEKLTQTLAADPRNLPAEAYKDPNNFPTGYDTADGATKKYAEGLEIGRRSSEVYISVTGAWGAEGKDGSRTTSYEVIGYHANTAALLRGFIDSGVKIVVYRWNPDGEPAFVPFTVQEARE
jgi:hypothetical protein